MALACLAFSASTTLAAGPLDAFNGLKGNLDIAGGTAHIPVMKGAAKQIMAANPDIRITVAGGGSGVGVQKAGEGLAQIGNTGRALKESEIKKYGLVSFPFAIDGVAVAVNPKNPVSGLSKAQLKDIFAGKITNWKEVGGEDLAIVPFQRGEDSGSQTLFRKLLIQGGELMDPPTELAPAAMGELVDSIAAYNNSANAIGFSVYYYIDQMYSQPGLRLLAVDGVTPSNDTIASESYPLCNEFYAVLHADAAADSPERQLYDWLDTAAGQDCIKKSGYVAVAPATAANSAV